MKTPFLTTSFSESGKQAKARFVNIFNRNIKSRGALAMVLLLGMTLFCGAVVGCDDSASIGVIGGADGPTNIVVQGNYPKSLHEVISATILEYNKDRYVEGLCQAEGHILLGTEEADGILTVYTISTYGTYNFCGDHFEHGSGCGAIPTVMVFDADYNLLEYRQPVDGTGYTESIEEMFPETYHDRVLSIRSADADGLEAQKRTYAQAYLESVGKDMPIGHYGDFH